MRRATIGTRETLRRITFARALAGVVPPLLAALLASCQGDTLYDSGPKNVAPPQVAVVAPTAGMVVRPGKTVRVQVQANDARGVSSMQVDLTGALSATVRREYKPAQDFVVIDTTITLAADAKGELQIRATATNSAGAVARTNAVSLAVGADVTPPVVTFLADTLRPRMELTDSNRFRVHAVDNEGASGVALLGATILVVDSTTGAVRQALTPRIVRLDSATISVAFAAPTPSGALPARYFFQIYGFAQDSAGNCAAATPTGNSLPCRALALGGSTVTVSDPRAANVATTIVAGRSFGLPAGTVISDVVADPARAKLYLSNKTANRLEVFDIMGNRFGATVSTGAQPWGLALNRTSDTLIVANSGGTNISYVPLGGSVLSEAIDRRIKTPNTVLFTVDVHVDAVQQITRYNAAFIDFSDRPEFLAQDSTGRLLYSTFPTAAAPKGTIRVAENQPGWEQPEVRLLLAANDEGGVTADTAVYSFARIDSLRVFNILGGSDRIELYDHRSGFPSQVIKSGILPIQVAIDSLLTRGSDMLWVRGRWDLSRVGLSDTTFVTASGDRAFVAFGEGHSSAGRVIMWNAGTQTISNEITIADLVGNQSEHIVSLDLNGDGSIGATRGVQGAYYFTNDLRLQGSAPVPVNAPAGAGAVLDSRHPTYSFATGGARYSYVASADHTIRIYDTVHFSQVGEIPLRDNIIGPLRASPPIAGEPCGTDCPIAKLYGMTSSGSLVVVNVRQSDIKQ